MSTAKHFLNIGLETIKGAALHALKDAGNAGAYNYATLDLTGVVVDQETFTLGGDGVTGLGDVYEVNLVATDTLSESVAQVEVGDTSIVFDTQPGIAMLPGDAIRMESEFMIVVDYNANGTGSVNVVRGAFGSTEAQHTILNSDTFQAAQPVAAGNLAVPVAAAAAATAKAEIAAAVAFWNTGYSKGLGGGIGVKVKNGLKVDAFVGAGTNDVVFAYAANGAPAAETAEGFTNGTLSDPFVEGLEPAGQRYTKVFHLVTAGDVSAGSVDFVAPFTVAKAVTVAYTSTGLVNEAWDGAVVVTNGRLVQVDNSGVTDWAAGDTLEITFFE